MTVLPALNTLSGFVINIIYKSWNYFIPCKICKQGEALVKCRLGKVIEEKRKPGLYWKFPLIDEFDTINMKIQTSYLNAHSFLMKSRKDATLPTNIVIDAQIEYKIQEPTCIYTITEKSLATCIDNKVHEIINEAINNTNEDIANVNIFKLCETIDEIRKNNNTLKYNSLNPDNNFEYDSKNEKEIIEITKIIITSFDYNFSLRTTQ